MVSVRPWHFSAQNIVPSSRIAMSHDPGEAILSVISVFRPVHETLSSSIPRRVEPDGRCRHEALAPNRAARMRDHEVRIRPDHLSCGGNLQLCGKVFDRPVLERRVDQDPASSPPVASHTWMPCPTPTDAAKADPVSPRKTALRRLLNSVATSVCRARQRFGTRRDRPMDRAAEGRPGRVRIAVQATLTSSTAKVRSCPASG
jgi:hypothetical protein